MSITLLSGDARDVLPTLAANSVHCVVTSPPYWNLRDYGTAQWDGGDKDCDHKASLPFVNPKNTLGHNGHLPITNAANQMHQRQFRDTCGKCGARRVDRQIGLEATPDEYLATMVAVFREVRRVLRPDGTLWLNVGSSYASGTTKGRGASGGKRPSQSPDDRRALACDSDGIEPQGCPVPDCVYPDLDDECLDGSQSHHGRTSDSGQLTPPSSLLVATTAHDSGPLASTGAAPSLLDVLASTTLSLSPNAQGASGLACVAVDPVDAPTLRPATPGCARKASSSFDTLQQPLPSVSRRQDKALSSRACDCGSCGICFAYLAMSCLRFKAKDLMLMPELVAMALQADGWFLRSDIIWSKPNPMPEAVTDRPTSAYEHVFLLTKSARYFWDAEAVREEAEYGRRESSVSWHEKADSNSVGARISETTKGRNPETGRNCRNVWTIATHAFSESHFATMPPAVVERCIRAGTSERGCCAACGAPWRREVERTAMVIDRSERTHPMGRTRASGTMLEPPTATTTGWAASCACAADVVPATVLDPFSGASTTLLVAQRLQRQAIGIELNPDYVKLGEDRLVLDAGLFSSVDVAHAETACSQAILPLNDNPDIAVPGFAQPDLFAEAAD